MLSEFLTRSEQSGRRILSALYTSILKLQTIFLTAATSAGMYQALRSCHLFLKQKRIGRSLESRDSKTRQISLSTPAVAWRRQFWYGPQHIWDYMQGRMTAA